MAHLDLHDLDGVVAHYAAGARFHGWAPDALGVDGYHAFMGALLAAFPDARFPVDDVVAEGDRVAVRHRLVGTHGGPFEGLPPTGRTVEIGAIVLLRFEGGRVAEGWLSADLLGLMQQIGAIPTSAAP
jgi:predicted ester cyclase